MILLGNPREGTSIRHAYETASTSNQGQGARMGAPEMACERRFEDCQIVIELLVHGADLAATYTEIVVELRARRAEVPEEGSQEAL